MRHAVWVGLSAGLALVTKFSMVLLVPMLSAVFLFAPRLSSINIGVRHFLPAYPFLFILSGAFLDFLLGWQGKRIWATTLVVLLFGWMSLETVRTYPDYISR